MSPRSTTHLLIPVLAGCLVLCAGGVRVDAQDDQPFDNEIDRMLASLPDESLTLIDFQPPRRGQPGRLAESDRLRRPVRRRPIRSQPLLARVPSMIGDFFGGGRPRSGPNTQNRPAPPRGGAAVRSVKIAENYTPAPRNRLFATYHFFNDVFDGEIGDVNRYTLGFESKYWDENRSVELRIPFANTLDSRQLDDPVAAKDTELGNVALTFKNLLVERDNWLLSGGLGIAFPTADDSQVARPSDMREILRVENEAIHLLPFLGMIATPHERLFIQSSAQLDIDTSGNRVRGDLMAMNLQPLGVIQDSTLLFLDLSLGCWVYENPDACRLTGVAPIVELHYTTTLNDGDLIQKAGFLVGDLSKRFDILNLTIGTHFEFQNRCSLRPGFVIPLRDGDDQQFDFEFFLQGNVGF